MSEKMKADLPSMEPERDPRLAPKKGDQIKRGTQTWTVTNVWSDLGHTSVTYTDGSGSASVDVAEWRRIVASTSVVQRAK